jgi:protein SCO1/2
MIVRRTLTARAAALLCGAAMAFAWERPAAALGNASEPPPIGSTEDPNSATKPPILRDVGFDQKIGAKIPLDTPFRDENGNTVRLGDLFHGRPVVLALAYYECPMLCTMVLNGVVSGLKPLAITAGKDFDVIAVSFNPRETSTLAKAKRVNYLDRYGKLGTEDGWHFLTGDPASIDALTSAVGFRYAWDAPAKQYAHPSGIVLLTPDGQVSRYLFGVEYEPKDLKLGLVESSQGKLGSLTDQVMLYCFHYDPATGRYSAAVMNLVRAGAVLTLVLLALFLILSWRRDAARARRVAEGAPSLRAR